MQASKESAQRMLDLIRHGEQEAFTVEDIRQLREFLEAAYRRLPSEDALARDKERKRIKKPIVS